jgi:hypothetical protein
VRFHATHKKEIVTQKNKNTRQKKKQTHPNSARRKCHHTTPEPRPLPLPRHSFIHAFPEPHISLDIPRVQQHLEVGCQLDPEWPHIRCAVPSATRRGVIVGRVPHTCHDARALRQSECVSMSSAQGEGEKRIHTNLRQCPDSIILAPLNHPKHLHPPNPSLLSSIPFIQKRKAKDKREAGLT